MPTQCFVRSKILDKNQNHLKGFLLPEGVRFGTLDEKQMNHFQSDSFGIDFTVHFVGILVKIRGDVLQEAHLGFALHNSRIFMENPITP